MEVTHHSQKAEPRLPPQNEDAQSTTPETGDAAIDLPDTGRIQPPDDSNRNDHDPPPYSTFTIWQKRLIVLSAALSALISSWTAQIYLPALPAAAGDLGVSTSEINLTVTVYMIFQSVTPIFVGGWSDVRGRRPAFVACFAFFVVANVALALTDSYDSLLGLRCFQSITISAVQSLCQAVVADVATSADRGHYVGFVALPQALGPSLGPVIGGAIATYFDWRSIFWFLTYTAVPNLAVLILVFPETCRNVVGDGSLWPSRMNQSVWQLARHWRRSRRTVTRDNEPQIALNTPLRSDMRSHMMQRKGLTKSRLLTALLLLTEKELGLVFVYSGCVFASVFAIGTAAPTQLSRIYGFDPLRVGLMYLPMAAGSIFAAALSGPGLNWNYRRHATALGLPLDRTRQLNLENFPIEKVRLQVALPWLVFGLVSVTAWGWALEKKAPVAVICVLVFFIGLGLVGTSNALMALVADIRPGKTGAAAAANNIVKFTLGAGMSAAIEPLIVAVGPGKAYTVVAGLYILLFPCLFLVWRRGMRWRRELREEE